MVREDHPETLGMMIEEHLHVTTIEIMWDDFGESLEI